MITLYNHQKVALAHLRLNDSFLLDMEQGTGKTIPTLVRICELLESGRIEDALIVCPKAVVGSWERDIEKLGMGKWSRWIVITTYEQVWRREAFRKHWGCIVLDEAHKIKTRTSKRSRCLLEMALDSEYRYELTGTPISNGQLENIWSLMAFLFPEKVKGKRAISCKLFGSFYDWLDRYAYLNQWHQPYKYHNVDELQTIIGEHSYRVLKADCLDLPDKLPDEVYDIECGDKRLYKRLHEDSAIEEFDLLAENSLSRMTKLRQFCGGWVNNGQTEIEIPCEKYQALADFVESMGGKKLVIFCEFRNSIDLVSEQLKAMHIKHLILDGRTKDKTCWKQFQTDKSVQVIICQYQSANAGIDLFAADTILFYEPTLSSNVLEQAKDRIHRIGQTSKCSYVHFITKGTIERHIYHALSHYKDFSDKMFSEYMKEYTKGR